MLIFYSLSCSRLNEDGDGGKRRYFADDGEGRERVGCSRQRGEGLGGVSREGLSRRAVNADSWAAITVHSGKGEGEAVVVVVLRGNGSGAYECMGGGGRGHGYKNEEGSEWEV